MVSKRGGAWSTVPGTLGRGRGARAVAVGSPPPPPPTSSPTPRPSLSRASHVSQLALACMSRWVGRRGPAPGDRPWPGRATWGLLLGVGPLKCHPMAGEQKP